MNHQDQTLGDNVTVERALDLLRAGGVRWSPVWMRQRIASGHVKSVLMVGRRLIPMEEITRVIQDQKAKRKTDKRYN